MPAPTGPALRPCTAATATEVHAGDLTLDKFIDAATLTAAPTLPGPSAEVRTVLLTGATGFLGRYLVLEWLRADGAGRRHADLPGAGRVRRGCAAPPGQDLRQRRPRTAAALPGTGRRSSGGHRRRQGRSQPGPGPADLAAAGRHRRSDRRSRGPGQRRPALQRAVRAQRRGHRRADPHRAHHEAQALQLTCRLPTWATRSSRRRSPRMPTSGSSAPPAQSTAATPTATATASGPARCCCARPTTCAGCRSRCFAAT